MQKISFCTVKQMFIEACAFKRKQYHNKSSHKIQGKQSIALQNDVGRWHVGCLKKDRNKIEMRSTYINKKPSRFVGTVSNEKANF